MYEYVERGIFSQHTSMNRSGLTRTAFCSSSRLGKTFQQTAGADCFTIYITTLLADCAADCITICITSSTLEYLTWFSPSQ